MDIIDVLSKAVQQQGSDILFAVGAPPMIRFQGKLRPYGKDVLTPELSKRLVYSILDDEQKATFEEHLELDLSISIKGIGRYRVNCYKQQGYVGAAFRVILAEVPTIDQLQLPPVIREMCHYPNGLVLVTGPTGSGKSTTLASMVHEINQRYKYHIVTVEDPIEFVHKHDRSLVDQREIGVDTLSYKNALKYVLRQNPDVIMVGEMRDLETIAAALTLAETGHLVLSTLHTTSAAQTIDRIVDVFPPYQQQQIRVQLSITLRSVVCQLLMPTTDNFSRVAVREIMLNTPAVANLIREGKSHMITNVIQTQAQVGMITMDDSILMAVHSGKISKETAMARLTENGRKRLGRDLG